MNGNNTQLWIRLIVLAFVFGGPVIGWVIRKIKEQAQLKLQREAEAQARVEALRTGKLDPVAQRQESNATGDAELESIAVRRKAQIDELRRRAAERGTAAPRPPQTNLPPTPKPPPATFKTVSAKKPSPGERSTSKGSSAKPQPFRASGTRPAPRPAEAGFRVQYQPAPQAAATPARPEPSPITEAPSAFTIRPPAIATLAGVPTARGAAQWRRAIILSEVLGDPVSQREDL